MVQNQRPSAVKVVVSALITILIFPAITIFLSGDWHWPEGWIFSLWFAAMTVATTIYLAIYDPALLEKPRLVVANKMDEAVAEKYLKQFKTKNKKVKVLPISAAFDQGMEKFRETIRKEVEEAEEE